MPDANSATDMRALIMNPNLTFRDIGVLVARSHEWVRLHRNAHYPDSPSGEERRRHSNAKRKRKTRARIQGKRKEMAERMEICWLFGVLRNGVIEFGYEF